jgi:putative hydrolase of the HAD superfamily
LLDGVEWVLFDAVGTLIYPEPEVATAYQAVGWEFGSRLEPAEIRARFKAALRQSQGQCEPTSETRERERWRRIVASVFDDVVKGSDALFERLWEHFAAPEHWRAFDDVEALSELTARGFKIGIASNFDGRLKGILAGHPVLAACTDVFVSSEIGFTKPDVRFFREIERRLDVPTSCIALVGDDEVADVEGAMAAGWRAVRLARDGERVRAGTIRSLRELV